MKFADIVRLLSIGSSHSGKTTLILKMILRGCFGNHLTKDYIIYILSPSTASLNQGAWNHLVKLGYRVERTVLDNDCLDTLALINNSKSAVGKCRIMIVDDLAKTKARGVKDYIGNMFAVESHHGNIHMVLLSHQLTNGIVQSRSSCDYMILHNNTPKVLKGIALEYGLDYNLIQDALSKPEGLTPAKHDPSVYDNYNYVIILRHNYKDKYGRDVPVYYQLSDTAGMRDRMEPIRF